MPIFPKTVEVTTFNGLNNVLPPERTPLAYLKVAENVDIDKSGGIHKRPGYTKKISGNFHSLWGEGDSLLTVKDGDLVRVADDFSVVTLKTLQSNEEVFFSSVDGSKDIYFVSPGGDCGHIVDDVVHPFGISRPNSPSLSEVVSNSQLTSGKYQVALTYVDSERSESGSGVAISLSIQDGSAITVSDVRASAEVGIVGINIYCSPPNGDVLYKIDQIPNVNVTYTITEVHSVGVTPLKSFNMSPAPYGDTLSYYKGRFYVSEGNILWYSSPFSLKWFNKQSDFFVFESAITEVMPVDDGIWVGTETGLYYLRGNAPEKMTLNLLESVSIVKGTGEKIMGAYLFIENTPLGYKWLVTSDKGVFVCFNNGITLNLTEANVVFPQANRGASTFIQKDGINRYLTLLEEKKPSNNASASDIVTATVIRNGIAI